MNNNFDNNISEEELIKYQEAYEKLMKVSRELELQLSARFQEPVTNMIRAFSEFGIFIGEKFQKINSDFNDVLKNM